MRISDWSSDVCSSDLHLLAHLCGEADAGALECRGQNVLQLAAQRGVVAVARHKDHAGHEALEGVAAHEEGGAVTLLQVQHADRDLVQVRSEEHTSELQSLMRISYAVFCLKKKKQTTHNNNHKHSK